MCVYGVLREIWKPSSRYTSEWVSGVQNKFPTVEFESVYDQVFLDISPHHFWSSCSRPVLFLYPKGSSDSQYGYVSKGCIWPCRNLQILIFAWQRERLLNRVILSWGNGLRSKETNYTPLFLARRKLHDSGRTGNPCSATVKDSKLWYVLSQDFCLQNVREKRTFTPNFMECIPFALEE